MNLSPIPEVESNFSSWQIKLIVAFEPQFSIFSFVNLLRIFPVFLFTILQCEIICNIPVDWWKLESLLIVIRDLKRTRWHILDYIFSTGKLFSLELKRFKLFRWQVCNAICMRKRIHICSNLFWTFTMIRTAPTPLSQGKLTLHFLGLITRPELFNERAANEPFLHREIGHSLRKLGYISRWCFFFLAIPFR